MQTWEDGVVPVDAIFHVNDKTFKEQKVCFLSRMSIQY